MEWNSRTLNRLSEIFGSKSKEIRWLATSDLMMDNDAAHAAYDKAWTAYDKAWTAYLLGLGLKMEPLVGVADPDHLACDGRVRIVNAWGDRYVEVPEELALKILALGFLP